MTTYVINSSIDYMTILLHRAIKMCSYMKTKDTNVKWKTNEFFCAISTITSTSFGLLLLLLLHAFNIYSIYNIYFVLCHVWRKFPDTIIMVEASLIKKN